MSRGLPSGCMKSQARLALSCRKVQSVRPSWPIAAPRKLYFPMQCSLGVFFILTCMTCRRGGPIAKELDCEAIRLALIGLKVIFSAY